MPSILQVGYIGEGPYGPFIDSAFTTVGPSQGIQKWRVLQGQIMWQEEMACLL
jgi:hypothetical protein